MKFCIVPGNWLISFVTFIFADSMWSVVKRWDAFGSVKHRLPACPGVKLELSGCHCEWLCQQKPKERCHSKWCVKRYLGASRVGFWSLHPSICLQWHDYPISPLQTLLMWLLKFLVSFYWCCVNCLCASNYLILSQLFYSSVALLRTIVFLWDGVFSAFCFDHPAYLVLGDRVNVGCLLIKTVPPVGFCWLLRVCVGLVYHFCLHLLATITH